MRKPWHRGVRRAEEDAVKEGRGTDFGLSISDGDSQIIERAAKFTMTGEARLQSLIDAVRHCVRTEVRGDFVECGVWRGGSVLAMALALMDMSAAERDLYLFDTFEGMTEPTARDVSFEGESARLAWERAQERDGRLWEEVFGAGAFGEDRVRKLLWESGYPKQLIHLVAGKVEDTVPGSAPNRIALLRLDTDWYQSTKHELEHLYPRLVEGGVLIIDDYGHWEGARAAVDEYFGDHPPLPFLHRIDYTGRIAIKPTSR